MHSRSFDMNDSNVSSTKYNSNSDHYNNKENSERLSSENYAKVFDLQDRKILYKVLNVAPQASQREIKRAYYTLAIVYHPDKNPHGEELFKEISFAYNILSDEQQRRMYDAGTLRSYLQGMARSYDPTMDPLVQLSPEELRRFVEHLQKEHVAKQEKLSAFEQRREEELQRRAEYDATHPEFKVHYEQERQKWMAQFDKTAWASSRYESKTNSDCPSCNDGGIRNSLHENTNSAGKAAYENFTKNGNINHNHNENSYNNNNKVNSLATLPFSSQKMCNVKPFRTSAELVASLQEEEQRRLYGERTSEPSLPAVRLRSIKEQMMRQYYKSHDDHQNRISEEVSNGYSYRSMRNSNNSNNLNDEESDHCSNNINCNSMTRKVNGQSQSVEYSSTISEKLRTCTNFDYLDFVEHDKEDNELIKDAILADALGHYSRYH